MRYTACMWCRTCRWARWGSDGAVSLRRLASWNPSTGEGGHARPHQSVDAVWLAARVITELQQTIARRLDALQPVVIGFGKVEGGRAFNVIADQVRLLGTVRCLDLQQHAQLPAWIEETVQGICASGGVRPWSTTAALRHRCITIRSSRPCSKVRGGVSWPRQGAAGGATFTWGGGFR